ncbi:MAG: ABC transporter substrate-binding protein [Rhizobacter sp.]|nr:ABC transporter substrate-binding protein [Rhizobacter sp.]
MPLASVHCRFRIEAIKDERDSTVMDRRQWLTSTAALTTAALLPGERADAARHRPDHTLRVAFATAETGFDPVQVSDSNSSMVVASIFEPPLTFDYLARPVKLRPQTAAALPEISADFRTFTFRLRPGIYFADDPVFMGRPRELVAQDYVYAIKRFYDPKLNAEFIYVFQNAGVMGLGELRAQARRDKSPFDYDTEVEGLRALDRYTFQVRLVRPGPRFHYEFANPTTTGAVAREVVEAYGDDIAAHPVGTGPFKLAGWRRASRIELVRNPGFREQIFDAEPAADDAQAQAIARELAGRRLPLVDRVEISVITEAQPRWLAFVNGALDQLALPPEFAPVAAPGDVLAPHLARKGVRLQRALQPDMAMTYFNMQNTLVGGNEPCKVALRRAVALAYDNDEANRLVRNGQAIGAQSLIAPFTSGFDAGYRSEMGQHSWAHSMALLDMFGYIDRDGDGWREQPDGSPLTLRLASTPDQVSRRRNELWRKKLAAVGLRMVFDIATWPDLLKMTRTGRLMMWGYAWAAGGPDGGFFLGIAYGPNASESNDAHFSLPAYDRLFERQAVLPDGPEREVLMRKANNLLAAYMPYKAHAHTIVNDLLQPRVRGYWRHPFMRDQWRYVGVVAQTD